MLTGGQTWACPSMSPKVPLSMKDLGNNLTSTWLTPAHIPNGISNGSSVIRGSQLWQIHTDRQTDRGISATVGRNLCYAWRLRLIFYVHACYIRNINLKITKNVNKTAGRLRHCTCSDGPLQIFLQWYLLFTARCYASAVFAVIVCPSLRPSARLSVTSRYCIETTRWIELAFGIQTSFHLSGTVL